MPAEELKPGKYHEVMNSVSVVKNMAELLMEGETEPSRKEMLLKIIARSDKIAELIQ